MLTSEIFKMFTLYLRMKEVGISLDPLIICNRKDPNSYWSANSVFNFWFLYQSTKKFPAISQENKQADIYHRIVCYVVHV